MLESKSYGCSDPFLLTEVDVGLLFEFRGINLEVCLVIIFVIFLERFVTPDIKNVEDLFHEPFTGEHNAYPKNSYKDHVIVFYDIIFGSDYGVESYDKEIHAAYVKGYYEVHLRRHGIF